MKEHEGRVNPFVNRKPLTRGGRESFLTRVREGLQHGGPVSPVPATPPPERDERLIRQAKTGDPELLARWVNKARANTMVVHRVAADPAAVRGAIDASFAAHTISRALVNAGALEARFGVTDHLRQKGIDVLAWGAEGCGEAAFHCDAAVTDCRAGLADTGAVMVWSDAGFGRSSTLVVHVHVILLPASRMLADMLDGFEFLLQETAGQLPSNVIIINGPSKTADIEMNLVTGVHGPKFLYVVLIDGM